ncbi:MAG: acyltransferase, partial [Rhodocyclaceae bacterium]
RLWWRARKCGARIASSAILRGSENIEIGIACRIGRLVELNARQGSIRLGNQTSIGPYTLLEARGGQIKIGPRTVIGPFCALYGQGNLEIGADCMIASHVVCIPENHRFDRLDVPMRAQGVCQQGIRIGDDVWLATRVVVVDGVSIGQGAVIGAGAVVTHDVPPYAIAHGVPARVVGYRRQRG